jgi:hypothetical protein
METSSTMIFKTTRFQARTVGETLCMVMISVIIIFTLPSYSHHETINNLCTNTTINSTNHCH